MKLNACERCGSTCVSLGRMTIKSWNPEEEEPRIEYFLQCTECGKASTVADTIENAHKFWNKVKR